jgi:hypothetical protein
MKRTLLTALAASTLVFGLTPASGYEKSIDESVKALIALQSCQDSIQLDCIEKVTVTHADGTSKDAKLTFGKLSNLPNMGASRYENQPITISYEYEKSGGPTKTASIYANLKTQWIDIPAGGINVPGLIIGFQEASRLYETDSFTFVVRTSWLKPQNVALYAKNAVFKEESINGGKRFTFGGSKLTQALFDDPNKYSLLYKPEGEFLKADRTQDNLYLIFDHAAKYSQSAYPTTCADQGYPVASSNASSAGQPKLKGTNEIEYSIAAPHFKADGTIFQGYFQAELNTKYLECVWPGNEISKSTEFSVSVIDDKGVKQVATTAVSFKNNIISVKAFGFHYSAPTIKLEGNYGNPSIKSESSPIPVAMATPSPSPSPNPQQVKVMKRQTITCVNGKINKRVTAMNPKCPVGYKKK